MIATIGLSTDSVIMQGVDLNFAGPTNWSPSLMLSWARSAAGMTALPFDTLDVDFMAEIRFFMGPLHNSGKAVAVRTGWVADSYWQEKQRKWSPESA